MKLYNTLTRSKEDFEPLEAGKVKLYSCGLTVYSQPHIGNWVAYIYWDLLQRVLKADGLQVTRVQNITDVGHLTSDEDAGEDKMLKGALREGLTAWQVAEKYIQIANHEAHELLGLEQPTYMPRATEYIQQQIDFVKLLEEKDFTYTIADGVYFDTSKLSDYGKLARLDIDGLEFGARVADTGKKNPTDFALWKFSNPNEKRDMEWKSPWGIGFPGWHLECSVMARELLGDQIDIHTGGIDHIPVHHTNEIAQTEAVTGHKFANIWLHANHIKVDGTKMSKSLGNIHTLQDILDRGYDLQAFKLLVLSKHYRTEGNFTWEVLEASKNRLARWQAVSDQRWQVRQGSSVVNNSDIEKLNSDFLDALNDDLGSQQAVAIIDAIMDLVEKHGINADTLPGFQQTIHLIDTLFGIKLSSEDISEQQKQLIQERESARAVKDWTKSDEIRNQLKQEQIELDDTEHGTRWYRS